MQEKTGVGLLYHLLITVFLEVREVVVIVIGLLHTVARVVVD